MSLTSACSAEPSLAVQTVPYWAIVEPSNALAAVTESGRLRLLTSLLETTATTIINKDNAILGGGSVDDAAIRAAAQEYGTALWPQLLPVAVAVAFALIMWPILWIGRCCAHKCWKPHYGHYSTHKKRNAFQCYALLWVLIALAILFSGLAGAHGANEMRRTACAVDAMAANVTVMINRTGTMAETLVSSFVRLHGNVRNDHGLASSLHTLVGPQMAIACSGLTGATASATAVVDLATTASATIPAAMTSAQAQMADSTSLVCNTEGYLASIQDAENKLGSVASRLDAILPDLGLLSSLSWQSMQSELTGARERVAASMTQALWEPSPTLHNLSGIILFGIVIIVMVLSLLGVCCLCRRHSTKTCSGTTCGIQCVGFMWVITSILVVLHLTGAGLLMFASVAFGDATTLLRALPLDPEGLLGPAACANWTFLAVPYGQSIRVCEALSTCAAGDSSLAELALSSMGHATDGGLDTSYLIEQASMLRTSNATAVLNQLTSGATALSDTTTEFSGLTPESFGVSDSSSAAYTAIASELALITANLTLASTAITAVRTPAERLSLNLQQDLAPTAEETANALSALLSGTSCGELFSLYESILEPLSRFIAAGLGAIGLAMLFASVLLALWIGPSILLQIRYGEVGREPGCPKMLRCCCKSEARPKGAKKAIKADAVSVQVSANIAPVGV